jgi:hypothetical protein
LDREFVADARPPSGRAKRIPDAEPPMDGYNSKIASIIVRSRASLIYASTTIRIPPSG